jgi:hypothetical protein
VKAAEVVGQSSLAGGEGADCGASMKRPAPSLRRISERSPGSVSGLVGSTYVPEKTSRSPSLSTSAATWTCAARSAVVEPSRVRHSPDSSVASTNVRPLPRGAGGS